MAKKWKPRWPSVGAYVSSRETYYTAEKDRKGERKRKEGRQADFPWNDTENSPGLRYLLCKRGRRKIQDMQLHLFVFAGRNRRNQKVVLQEQAGAEEQNGKESSRVRKEILPLHTL